MGSGRSHINWTLRLHAEHTILTGGTHSGLHEEKMHADLSSGDCKTFWWCVQCVHQEHSSKSFQFWGTQFWHKCTQHAWMLHAHLSRWRCSELDLIDLAKWFWSFCPFQHVFNLFYFTTPQSLYHKQGFFVQFFDKIKQPLTGTLC